MKRWQGIELKEQESSIKEEDSKFKMKYDNSHYGKYSGIKFEEDKDIYDKLSLLKRINVKAFQNFEDIPINLLKQLEKDIDNFFKTALKLHILFND